MALKAAEPLNGMAGSSSSKPSVEPKNGTRVDTPGMFRDAEPLRASLMLSDQQSVVATRSVASSQILYQSAFLEQYQWGVAGLSTSFASSWLLPSPGTMMTGDSAAQVAARNANASMSGQRVIDGELFTAAARCRSRSLAN